MESVTQNTLTQTPTDLPGKNEVPAVRVIRTMKSDIADAIEKQNETAASIALAEAKKQERERAAALAAIAAKQAEAAAAPPPPKRRGRITLIIILLLLLVGGRIAYKLFVPTLTNLSLFSIKIPGFGTPAPETPTIAEPEPQKIELAPAILTPQAEKRFNLGRETPAHVSAGIALERTEGLTAGSIKNLYFTDQSGTTTVNVKDVFTFMGTGIPDSVLRSLNASFMFGFLGEEGSVATPFIILKVIDYDLVRAGMFTWESSLAKDFDALFGTRIAVATNTAKFGDTIVAGKDTRVLGTAPNASMFYAFLDSHTLIITSSKSALEQLVQRLNNI